MVKVMIMMVVMDVMVKVMVIGRSRAQRLKWIIRMLSQLKAEAEGEWKSKGWDWSLGYRGRWGEARKKGTIIGFRNKASRLL